MISLHIAPLITNAEVFIYDDCEPDDIASEFLPTSPNKSLIYSGEGVYLNEKTKSTKRSEGSAEENLIRVVDIYPDDAVALKEQLRTGAKVGLITNAYGKEEGYLEGIQFFDNNQIKLSLCLAKQ